MQIRLAEGEKCLSNRYDAVPNNCEYCTQAADHLPKAADRFDWYQMVIHGCKRFLSCNRLEHQSFLNAMTMSTQTIDVIISVRFYYSVRRMAARHYRVVPPMQIPQKRGLGLTD